MDLSEIYTRETIEFLKKTKDDIDFYSLISMIVLPEDKEMIVSHKDGMFYKYKLTSSGQSSYVLGKCEVCKKHCSHIYNINGYYLDKNLLRFCLLDHRGRILTKWGCKKCLISLVEGDIIKENLINF